MDNTTVETEMKSVECRVSDNGGTSAPIQSELLCFVRDKCKIIPFDDLLKLCCDFYSDEEIGEARRNILDWHKLPKRRGDDKSRSTMEDILKCMLDPAVALPVFYAVDLARLPPTNASQCDMSAVLQELQALRSEVRGMKQMQKEITDLRAELNTLQSQRCIKHRVSLSHHG